jgi:hypothetical protein
MVTIDKHIELRKSANASVMILVPVVLVIVQTPDAWERARCIAYSLCVCFPEESEV